MAINVSDAFKSHIEGKNTSLIPLIHIQDSNNDFYISTSHLNIVDDDIENITSLPILTSSPAINQSTDIQDRKYKISALTFQVSDYKYNGERFSDIIVGSLINADCKIYWVMQHSPNLNNSLLVYNGYIRQYNQGKDFISVEVEDKSQRVFYKDVHKTEEYLPSDDSVPEKYRGKPIPKVYGYVDKSPLVFKDQNITLLADTDDSVRFNTSTLPSFPTRHEGTLWIDTGTHYVNIEHNLQQNIEQYKELDTKSIELIVPSTRDVDINEVEDVSFRCFDISKEFKMTLSNILEDENLTTEDFVSPPENFSKMKNGIYESLNRLMMSGFRYSDLNDVDKIEVKNRLIVFYDSRQGNLGIDFRVISHYTNAAGDTLGGAEIEHLLLKWGFSYKPDYDHNDVGLIGMTINNIDISAILPHNGVVNYTGGRNATVLQTAQVNGNIGYGDAIQGLSDEYSFYGLYNDHGEYDTLKKVFGFTGTDYYHADTAIPVTISGNAEGNYHSITTFNYETGQANIKEIELLRRVNLINPFKNGFYANVIGREDQSGVIETAPAIIGNLLSSLADTDLNHSINPNHDYNYWKYAFTVADKTLNSKKIIEDIASVSPYLIGFDALGNFNMTTIEHEYGAADHSIYINDIVNYKFTKTPIDDVYSRIDFRYKWDYARKEFSKRVILDISNFACTDAEGMDFQYDYYGFVDTDGNDVPKVLKIDDDRGKYIRNKATAQRYVSWMLSWYCNQHLKVEGLRLPLKYLPLEIGNIINFTDENGNSKLINDVKPYGIDYSLRGSYISNFQDFLPFFMILKIRKTIDYIEVDAIQLHELWSGEGVLEGDQLFYD